MVEKIHRFGREICLVRRQLLHNYYSTLLHNYDSLIHLLLHTLHIILVLHILILHTLTPYKHIIFTTSPFLHFQIPSHRTSRSLQEFMGLSMNAKTLASTIEFNEAHFELLKTLDLLPKNPGYNTILLFKKSV